MSFWNDLLNIGISAKFIKSNMNSLAEVASIAQLANMPKSFYLFDFCGVFLFFFFFFIT